MELKRREKIEKYQDLVREMRKMWKVKTEITPLVISALRTVPKEIETHLDKTGVKLFVELHTYIFKSLFYLRF